MLLCRDPQGGYAHYLCPGFHTAYWHDSFGSAASHGCINLAPADAKWLYDWAGLGERVIIVRGSRGIQGRGEEGI